MAGLTISGASGLLKEFYTEGPAELLNNSNVLWAQLERGGDDVTTEGQEAVWNTHVQRNWGVGFIPDGGALPTAGAQKYVKGRTPLRTIVGRVKFTKQVIQAAKSDRSAFVKAATAEMDGVVRDLKRQQERAAHGTSNGVIATCGTTTGSATVQLAATTSAAVIKRQFEIGMPVDIGTLASPQTIAASRTITAIDTVNLTIAISGAVVTTSASHFVFLAGCGGDSTGPNGQVEPTGVQTICNNSGTLFSIDPAVNPAWKAYVDSPAALRPVSELIFEKALDEVGMQGPGELDLFITTPGVKRAYAAQLQALKEFNDTQELKGGFKGLSVDCGDHTATMVGTKDCIDSTAYGFTTNTMRIHEWQPWGWMDEDGAVLSRVAGEYAYEAVYGSIFELGTVARNAHARLDKLIEA